MKYYRFGVLFFMIVALPIIGSASKILCVYPTIYRSHLIVVQSLMIELANRGHEITMISSFPPEEPIKNFRHIYISIPDECNRILKSYMDNSGDRMYMVKTIPKLSNEMMKMTDTTLYHEEVQNLMKFENFDLVVVEGVMGEAFLGFGAHFKCPTIMFTSLNASPLVDIVGNPVSIESISNFILGYKGMMNFKQRVYNFLSTCLEKSIILYARWAYQDYYDRHFPSPQYPTIEEMRRNVSLVFVATHFSQGDPRPFVPGMIEVGGIHIKNKPSPLPDDLQKWLDGSTNGAIYFSMGTNVKSSDFPSEKLNAVLKTFSKLKQTVLWKFENSSYTDIPKNVKIEKWLPQDDILAHPNIKLFITHGGLGSIVESRFHGVPIVGIPIFGDQMTNVESAVVEGWATMLHYTDLTEENFSSAVNEILKNVKYTDNVKSQSRLFRDRPITAMETGVFWTEYVIRHRGAKHMQSHAVYLNFWQRNSIDVIGFIAIVIFVVIKIKIFVVNYLFRKCYTKKIVKVKQN